MNAWQRRAAGMLGSYADSLGSLDSVIGDASAESTTAAFTDFATVTRQSRDENGTPLYEDGDDGELSPVVELVYEGPANLTKTLRPRFVSEAGGKESIEDWTAETPITYNPEPGDAFLCAGYLHFVKGSDEGTTNADRRVVYLLRSGRDNTGV